jgi:beta-N-acetylhexosaminidase
VISERTYGGDPQLVSQYVAQAVHGYRQVGVIPVLKHFPGHGSVAQDSHQVLPVDPADLGTLQAEYLPPFQAGLAAGAPVIMLNHIAFPAIAGDEVPSTLSPQMIDFIREKMDFEGVIMSDSLRMKAVTANKTISTQEIAVEAAISGDDMLLLNWDEHAKLAKEFLLVAVEQGDLSQERVDDAVRRILTLKAAWGLTEYHPVADPEPDWQANQTLAHQIGKRAVALLINDAELVPIPQAARRILIIGPEAEWEFYPLLEVALNQHGYETNLATFPPPWEGPVGQVEALDTLPGLAQYYDLTLVFTWQVHLNQLKYDDHWQAELVRRLSGGPLIVVAIRSPTDILEFPNVPTYLAMYGSTSGQTEALLDTLLGRQEAVGINPLPGLVE